MGLSLISNRGESSLSLSNVFSDSDGSESILSLIPTLIILVWGNMSKNCFIFNLVGINVEQISYTPDMKMIKDLKHMGIGRESWSCL